jgi:hypothetical protein
MEWTERIVGAFARALNVLSAVWLGSVALLILYDVVGRELFESPFHGTNEIVSNSVLSILFLQLPLSILTRSSLRTTILYDHAGDWGKALIEATSYILVGEQEGSGIVEIPVYPIRTLVVFVSFVGIAVCALLTTQALRHPHEFIHRGSSDGA